MQSNLKTTRNSTRSLLLLLCFLFVCTNNVDAQTDVDAQQIEAQSLDNSSANNANEVNEANELKKIEQLKSLDLSIKEKTEARRQLRLVQDSDDDNIEIDTQIIETGQDLEIAKKSFEQVAIGGISLEVFNAAPESQDWREELALVIQPLLENLNHLTEKPRKQEALRRVISTQQIALSSADRALTSIDTLLQNEDSESIATELNTLRNKWLGLKANADRQRQLAVYELDNLNGENKSWFESFKESFNQFARDRGLTLLLAILVSLFVWLIFKAISKLTKSRGQSKYAQRASYRVIKYAQKLMTVLFVIISILMVFFIRGDVLLLALSAIIIFAVILGLRNLIPKFIAEARVLLNISSVRENQYVLYKGVPWRVASLNVYSKLINPEIRGVLILPLAVMKDLVSRPSIAEKWFPSSIGDWVLDDDGHLYEVVQQTPDTVELRSGQGSSKLVPTDTYFAAGLVNLTQSKKIRIVSHFGLDYSLQAIALDVIPRKLKEAVQTYLETSELDTPGIETRVEFEKAGESSLDYIIIVEIGSAASQNFYRVKRYIQQACVSVANEEGWTIPFAQLTVHKAESG